MSRFRTLVILAALLFAAVPAAIAQSKPGLPRLLFFANPMGSDNTVIRRPSPDVLSVAEQRFAELSQGVFEVNITQNGAEVSAAKLPQYQVVVFFTAINPPGVEVDALVDWVARGGAFVGIHSTANTYQGHAGFGELLGARYDRRPWRTRENPQTNVRVKVDDKTHPATRHMGDSFEIADDIYLFKNFDLSKMTLLLSLDPKSLDLTKTRPTDKDFPVAWAKSHGKGRVFYTALGDWDETWKNPAYRTHIIEGIRWSMNAKPGGGR